MNAGQYAKISCRSMIRMSEEKESLCKRIKSASAHSQGPGKTHKITVTEDGGQQQDEGIMRIDECRAICEE